MLTRKVIWQKDAQCSPLCRHEFSLAMFIHILPPVEYYAYVIEMRNMRLSAVAFADTMPPCPLMP